MAKQMSREEMQKIRKDMIENSRTSLENVVYQDVMGANQLRTNPFKYGEYGLGAGERKYESFSQDEKIRKMKDDIFAQRQNRGKALGVYGEPVYPTNYDISLNVHFYSELVRSNPPRSFEHLFLLVYFSFLIK